MWFRGTWFFKEKALKKAGYEDVETLFTKLKK